MPETPITACLLFDDAPSDLELRRLQVQAALDDLAEDSAISFTGSVEPYTSRTLLLESLTAHMERTPRGRVLVVCDLFVDGGGTHGAMGARLLRAIASHPTGGPRTVRVALSKHATRLAFESLQNYVHGFCFFAFRGEGWVAKALNHSINHAAEEGATPRVWPVTHPPARWSDDDESTLRELVGDDIRRGDEVILALMVRGHPDIAINKLLRDDALDDESLEGEAPRRADVNAFVQAVRLYLGLADVARARARIMTAGREVALVRQFSDPVTYSDCDAALTWRGEFIDDYIAEARGDRDAAVNAWLNTTWLTPAEDQLLDGFLELYHRKVLEQSLPTPEQVKRGIERRAPAPNEKLAIIAQILGTRLDSGAPGYVQLRDKLGLSNDDLAYAVNTVADAYEQR